MIWIQFINSHSLPTHDVSQHVASPITPPLPTIFLPGDTECLWIEKWIDNPRLKSDLYTVRRRIDHLSEVDIYTDGSLSTTHIRIPPQASPDPSLVMDTQQGAGALPFSSLLLIATLQLICHFGLPQHELNL